MPDLGALSPDRPSIDPAQDLYGYAPFARTLVKAIQEYRGSDGIVLALYGPWGSGKSTVLANVQHELEQGPEEERPIVVPFNPWWFSGQEHLAKAFLGQLQVVLPEKYAKFKAFGKKLGKFSEAVGGATGQSWIPTLFRPSELDVPALKNALSKLLLEQKKRILIVIDDIDRLTHHLLKKVDPAQRLTLLLQELACARCAAASGCS